MKALQQRPGIGRWTANYLALRGWQAKDVFLPDDYLIKQRFAGMTPAQFAATPSAGSRGALTPCCTFGIPTAGRHQLMAK